MSDVFDQLKATVAAVDLSTLAFRRPAVITPDRAEPVHLATLKEMADYALAGACDPLTAEELAQRVLDAVKLVESRARSDFPVDRYGRHVFDAPSGRSDGVVIRKQRTDDEKRALLQDPNLPHDVRQEFEAQLGLPITPTPVKAPLLPVLVVGPEFGSAHPLPKVWADGREVGYGEFSAVYQFPDGVTVLVTQAPMNVTRIVSGNGFDMPLVGGARLQAGATLSVPLGKADRVSAQGRLMRDGKVVRDAPPPAEIAAEDSALEASLQAEARTAVKVLAAEKRPLVDMLTAVMRVGFHRPTAEDIVATELNLIGYDTVESYLTR